MTLRLAIFDLDGTLVDSRRTITAAMDTAFIEVGLEPPGYEKTRAIVGLSLEVACAELAPDGLELAQIHALCDAYKRAFVNQRGAGEVTEALYDGAAETVRRLEADGWLLSVATGKARRGINALFERYPDLGALFISTHCADDGPGKPDPHMTLEALRASGVEAENALVIGDTAHDMRMARNAGVRAVGVTWGFHTEAELAQGGAQEIHDDFATLNESLDLFAAGRAWA